MKLEVITEGSGFGSYDVVAPGPRSGEPPERKLDRGNSRESDAQLPPVPLPRGSLDRRFRGMTGGWFGVR
jgi:hypothetical protein